MSKILVIAEKPSVGRDLAKFLKCNENKKNYIEGPDYVVTWAYGHLVTLMDPEDYNSEDKLWNLGKLPIIPKTFKTKVVENTKGQFNVIKSLIHRNDITSLINAGDSGREGELIQRYIYELAGNTKPVQRLWISSLTEDSFKKGFSELKKQSDFDNLYEAAIVRSQLDWLYGLNYTRAYTTKYSNDGVLSVGRCQTPILKLICNRDKEIEEFVPRTYFELEADFGKYKGKYLKNKTTQIEKEEDVKKLITKLNNKNGEVISVKEEKKEVPSPLLYNLSSLSQKMNTKYGFSAQKTLDVLQVLYEQYKIATYPRASAEVISDSVYDLVSKNIDRVLFGNFEKFKPSLKIKKDKRYVNDAKIEDHHAIIPDFSNKDIEKIYPKLNTDQKNLFDELVKSVLAMFLPKYEYSTTTIITDVEGEMFFTRDKQQLSLGWRNLYLEEKKIDEDSIGIKGIVSKGETNKVLNLAKIEKQTKPKSKYNDSSILEEMKKNGIGTEATRANLIETLIKRKYVVRDKKSLISTDFGRDFIELIKIKDIKSVTFTSDVEKKLSLVADGKLKKEEIIKEVAANLNKNIDEIKNDETEVLSINSVGTCPICGKQVTKNSKGFGCSGYKEGCKFFIASEVCGKKISEKNALTLLEKGETPVIKGFVSKAGKSFDAKLIVDKSEGKVSFEFVDSNTDKDGKTSTSDIICPKCKNNMYNNDKVCKCTNCDIVIFKNICGKKISDVTIKKLLEKEETPVIKGFVSKAGKGFEAKLKLVNGRTELVFQ